MIQDHSQTEGSTKGLSFLSNPRQFWPLASFIFFVVALLKGLRFPNRWAATQALMDYRMGFIRRGFFGQFVTDPLHLYHYHRFVVFAFCAIAVMLVVLLVFTIRSGVFSRLASGEAVALFASSFAVTYFGNLIGYLDLILLLLTVSVLLVRKTYLRFVLALPVVLAGLLIHENFLILFFPLIFLSFVLQSGSSETGASTERRMQLPVIGLALAAIALMITFFIVRKPSLSPEQTASLQASLTAQADFPLRPEFFDVMTTSTGASVAKMFDNLLHNAYYKEEQFDSIIIFLPVVFLLILTGVRLLRNSSARSNPWAVPAFLLASLAPFVMHTIGYDVSRFNSFVCIDSFLAILLVSYYTQGTAPLENSQRFKNAAILVIALNMASGAGLMDWKLPHPYPFSSTGVHFLRELHIGPRPPAL